MVQCGYVPELKHVEMLASSQLVADETFEQLWRKPRINPKDWQDLCHSSTLTGKKKEHVFTFHQYITQLKEIPIPDDNDPWYRKVKAFAQKHSHSFPAEIYLDIFGFLHPGFYFTTFHSEGDLQVKIGGHSVLQSVMLLVERLLQTDEQLFVELGQLATGVKNLSVQTRCQTTEGTTPLEGVLGFRNRSSSSATDVFVCGDFPAFAIPEDSLAGTEIPFNTLEIKRKNAFTDAHEQRLDSLCHQPKLQKDLFHGAERLDSVLTEVSRGSNSMFG